MGDDFQPYCETADGCPLGDIASDPALNRLCFEWLNYRSAYELSKAQIVYDMMIKSLGFEDDPELLFKLEEIWERWKPKTARE